MDLTAIQDPSFLKTMNNKQLRALAEDIREFLIENVSKTGGHLSSNLGVVELTIALHKVFDSPQDKIFFDVGHQCYTHKILTGRAAQFPTLRQYQGISGFEKRQESEHDVWEAGHSSTSLSAALGMAVARDLNHQDYHVVPVIGDGALGGGMALEALNQIGSEQRNMIIIFNDNNMSISENVGVLTQNFAKLRASKGYNNLKQDLKVALNRNNVGQAVLEGLQNIKDAIKNGVIDTGVFGEFGLEYLGPVNGHDFKSLIQILEVAKKHQGPVVVHVLTKKGKGYSYCEEDHDGRWHGVSAFDPESGKSLTGLPEGHLSWSSVISEALIAQAKKNPDIMAVTPAMITGSKLEKFFALFPERSFDCGIAEEHAATFCAGLAVSGKRPFISLYSSFLQRAYDQINHDICRMDLPVVIGIDRAGLVGDDGETHHGVFDISIQRSLPNLILAQPKDAAEAQTLMAAAFAQQHPMAIRYPRGSVHFTELKDPQPTEIGTWTVFNEEPGNRCVVMTYGPDVDKVLSKVMTNSLPVTVVNARFFKPLDEALLMRLCQGGLPVVIYETDMLAGGLSSAVLEWCCDHHQNLEIHRLGIPDQYVPQGSMNRIRKQVGIDILSCFEEVRKICE